MESFSFWFDNTSALPADLLASLIFIMLNGNASGSMTVPGHGVAGLIIIKNIIHFVISSLFILDVFPLTFSLWCTEQCHRRSIQVNEG